MAQKVKGSKDGGQEHEKLPYTTVATAFAVNIAVSGSDRVEAVVVAEAEVVVPTTAALQFPIPEHWSGQAASQTPGGAHPLAHSSQAEPVKWVEGSHSHE